MANYDSIAAMVDMAQQEPQPPCVFTGVTLVTVSEVLQSHVCGAGVDCLGESDFTDGAGGLSLLDFFPLISLKKSSSIL